MRTFNLIAEAQNHRNPYDSVDRQRPYRGVTQERTFGTFRNLRQIPQSIPFDSFSGISVTIALLSPLELASVSVQQHWGKVTSHSLWILTCFADA